VAVLLINPSENVRLDDTFVTHQEEIVRIPMFSTSLQTGNQIESIITSKSKTADVKCEFMLVSQHEPVGKLQQLRFLLYY